MRTSPKPLSRIVLLEDFIGSGTQLMDAVPMIQQLTAANVPILLVPLLICPEGNRLAEDLANRFKPHLVYRPLIVLEATAFVHSSPPMPPATEPTLHQQIRPLIISTYKDVIGDNSAAPRPYTPFGFGSTGAVIVMYSNTPANTVSAIQHISNTWTPLFPRSARVR
jgi:hypothetical protein